MASPENDVPRLPKEYMTAVMDQFKKLADNISNDLYALGFEHGKAAAIDQMWRALKATGNGVAQPDASKQVRSRRPATSTEPGAETHKLIEAVLGKVAKATPTEIAGASENALGIKRDAIRNALRRGRSSGRYMSVGKGRYSLGKVEGYK